MLDEETGVRGFAATQRQLFLQPYNEALSPFSTTVRQLKAEIAPLAFRPRTPRSTTSSRSTRSICATVAGPLLSDPRRNTLAVEARGKAIVDRFRTDVATIDGLSTQRERVINDRGGARRSTASAC